MSNGIPGKPFEHIWMLVSCVIIDDGMNSLSCRDPRFDGVEKADKLLVPMTLHVSADDSAIEGVEGSKQSDRAMSPVIVRHCPGAPRLHR